MADSTCSLAVRTAYMLGLHLEPPQSMPRRERDKEALVVDPVRIGDQDEHGFGSTFPTA